jgi:phosphoribosylformylglycinamidine synthase PurS subunit
MTKNRSLASRFVVLVTIENKPHIDDPEGETIHRDLIVKGGYSKVESVRCAKTLKVIVKEKSDRAAEKIVEKLCEELRIFNPIVSDCIIKSEGELVS